MKKTKFLTLLAVLTLLTVPAQAKRDAPAVYPDAARVIASRCPTARTAWGWFKLPDFYCPDGNCSFEIPGVPTPTPAVPDTNTPSVPDANAPSAPDTNQPSAPTPAPDTNTPSAPDTNTPSVPETPSVEGMSEYELEVARLVNVERARHGLSALTPDAELSRVARYKSRDMREKGYFSHESPTYGTPFQMMKSFGITYRTAGENIAYGYATPAKVVEAWMNSEGHRANILNSSYTRIGVGYVADGNYWTQMFIG